MIIIWSHLLEAKARTGVEFAANAAVLELPGRPVNRPEFRR